MWIIVTLIVLAALVIFLLSVPLDLRFQLNTRGRPRFRIRLLWLFGLIDKELNKPGPKAKQRKTAGEKKKRADWKRAGTFFQILKIRELPEQFWSFLKNILGHLNIRDLVVNLRIGLDNPADTGMLFAIIAPANYYINAYLHKDINIQPSFDQDATFEGYLHGRVRVRPIRFIEPAIKLVFSLPVIRMIKKLAVAKWKRKI